jgi:hypothetical protein
MEVLDDRITPSLFTMIASVQTDGTQATENSTLSAVSDDGRFIAFTTTAKLVAEDTNAFADVYRTDTATGEVILISRGNGAAGAIGDSSVSVSFRPSLSGDGRLVTFSSNASNLVVGDTNATLDVFVRDVTAGTTSRVSVDSAGTQATGASGLSSISADGKFISFLSAATNLVAGDTNAVNDVFLRDLTANTTVRISTDSAGAQANGASANSNLSSDGRFVIFDSAASNLVLNDTNGKLDVFVKDVITGTTTRVSVASGGGQGDGASGSTGVSNLGVSADGKLVAFQSNATNLVTGDTNATTDIFVRDLTAGTTTRVSTDATGIQGNAASTNPDLSANGRFIAFESSAANLVSGDTNAATDVFRKDRIGGGIVRVSVATDGTEANSGSTNAAINRDGTLVAFESAATNLAPVNIPGADANGKTDAFARVLPLPALYVAGPAAGGSSQVRVFNADGTQKFSFLAYDPAYTGGVFVALGDVTGDGIEDIVTSTGKGGAANIRVFDGVTGSLISSFFAYPEAFTGGVNVAIGDVNNDGFADIICGVGVGGGPNVRVFDGKQVSLGNFSLGEVSSGGALLASFFAYPEGFTGGVRVAAGDVNGDGFTDIILGVGSGGGPNVRVLDGATVSGGNTNLSLLSEGGALISSFFGLPESFTGGVFIGAGDLDNDRLADVIIGVESGGGPNVRAFNATTTNQLRSFFAFDAGLTGGVRVASTDLNQDGFDDFVVGTGPGTGSLLRILDGRDGSTSLFPEFAPFGGFGGGVNVG